MPRTKSLALAALLLSFAFSRAATSEWLHFANEVNQAESAKQKHSRALTLWTAVATELANPLVCASYESNHPKGNKGSVASTGRIDRADGSTETLAFSGGVSANLFLECQPAAAPIGVGDQVTFDFAFDKLPRQKMKANRSDFFSVNGIVANGIQPSARVTPPGINPPPSGGQVHAAISLFAAERDRQRHPRKLTQSVLMPVDAVSPVICAALGNVSAKPDKGRVITAVTVMHQSGSVTNMSFDGKVDANIYAECQIGPDLAAGDVVVFDHAFRGLPRLRFGAGFFDPVATYGIVSPDGLPMVRANR